MKVLAIAGSRNEKGQTARAMEAFLSGVTETGVGVEKLFLPHMNIERCRQCNEDGWGLCRNEGRCVIEDDLSLIEQKIQEAKGVVFATPVYYSDLSESIRGFLDRFRRVITHSDRQEEVTKKPAVGICVAGGGGGGAPPCTVSLEKVLQRCGFDVVDMICARRQNLPMKEKILAVTGAWFAGSLC